MLAAVRAGDLAPTFQDEDFEAVPLFAGVIPGLNVFACEPMLLESILRFGAVPMLV
jgi:hypothetical protein